MFDMRPLVLENAKSGTRLAARASMGAMPGISPVKSAFQPSRNWASEMPIPSKLRKPAKNSASSISPRSCRCQMSSGEKRPTRCAGSQAAWVAQQASTLPKSISSTTRPRSNSKASAEWGVRAGGVIGGMYETPARRTTVKRELQLSRGIIMGLTGGAAPTKTAFRAIALIAMYSCCLGGLKPDPAWEERPWLDLQSGLRRLRSGYPALAWRGRRT